MQAPKACAEVETLEARSRFFRSLVVLFIGAGARASTSRCTRPGAPLAGSHGARLS
jgi:hypothetical protein